MLQRIKDLIRQVTGKMFKRGTIEKELQVDIVTSDKMARAINEWTEMYENRPHWLSDTVKSMNLAATVASEFARLITLEMESKVEGNDYLNEQYQIVINGIRPFVEYACAKGGVVFKPFINGENIEVDFTQADYFFPTSYNSRGEITGAVFVDTKTIGEKLYTRLEYHNLTADGYYIANQAYVTKAIEGSEALGKEIPLTEVDDWAELEPEVMIQNVDKPLFAYFKMPQANTIDPSSPLGVSVYSRAVGDIEEADRQYSRILWEYDGSELAIDASIDCFKVSGQDRYELPRGKERLFRMLHYEAHDYKKPFETFSPDIRDVSLFNGLNNLLKQIEFKCGLAYGTISDPQQVEKTAEEIKSSKQRSYQSVTDAQKSLQTALEHLVYAMGVVGSLAGLPVKTNNKVSSKWDDSIIIDVDKERISDRQEVAMGAMTLLEYRMKWYKEDEITAARMISEQADVVM